MWKYLAKSIEKKAENLGFNPKKYDVIINSLLKEINEVKKQKKKRKWNI